MPKRIDITGQRFGRLIAAQEVEKKGKERCWLCRCDCGNETIVRMASLRAGHTKSCGCLHKERAKGRLPLEVTEKQFHHLTLVKPIGKNNYNKSVWLCKCDCGNYREATLNALRRGYIKSCGCIKQPGVRLNLSHREILDVLLEIFDAQGELTTRLLARLSPFSLRTLYNHFPIMGFKGIQELVEEFSVSQNKPMSKHIKDLTGQRFGKLYVLFLSPVRAKNRKAIWVCGCDCRAITRVESHRIIDGTTTSCGCARVEKGKDVQQYNKKHLTKDGVYTPLLTSKVRSDSKTGVKGVRITKNGKYQARITVKKQQIHLGYFDTLEEAVKARKEAEKKYYKPYIDVHRMKSHTDLIGYRFGRLEVIRLERKGEKGKTYWLCKCDCDKTIVVARSSLTSGQTRSCGCLRRERSRNFALKNRESLNEAIREGVKKYHDENPYSALMRKKRADNKSGVVGVRFNKKIRKWVANITVNGKQIYLGSYEDKADAVQARKAAEEKYHKPLLNKSTDEDEVN